MASKSTIYKGLTSRTEFVISMAGWGWGGDETTKCTKQNFERLGTARNYCTVVPAKSDSDITFVYKVIRVNNR